MKNLQLSRREILQLSALAGGGLMIPGLFSGRAEGQLLQEPEPHYFLMIQIPGGWDTTLGVDPWLEEQMPDQKDLFIEYSKDQIFRYENLAMGPACEPLNKFADRVSIINGIFLSPVDNGHEAAQLYIESGSTLGGCPSLAVELSYATKAGPFGILANGGVVVGSRPLSVTNLDSLRSVSEAELPQYLKRFLELFEGSSPLINAQKSIVATALQVDQIARAVEKLQEEGVEITNGHLAGIAFQAGVSFSGEIRYNEVFLDTHSGHRGDHLRDQKKGFQFVADTFDFFKSLPIGTSGKSLFDCTTFMVTSEFSRTAALNGAGGKDHNALVNSVLLAGKGVRGGQMVGRSKLIKKAQSKIGQSYQIAMPFDFKTGQAVDSKDGTSFIFPEQVARTLAEIMKVDWERFKTVPQKTQFLRSIVL
ncbi:MAG: DUF1501 domain-containing protein [Pseudobdellovibrionaceae bacterium]